MWDTIDIAGRSAERFTPADRPRLSLVYLSDLDGSSLRDRLVWTSLLEEYRISCICLDGGESWWSDRLCRTFNANRSAENWLTQDLLPRQEHKVALIGVGAGGQGALRLAFKHYKRFRVVAAMESAIDHFELYGQGTALDEMYPSREHCRQDGVGLHVDPHHWPPHIWFACDPDSPWLRGNDRLHEKLMALGVPHTIDFDTPACGHSWAYYDRLAPKLIRFVVDGMERESRRLF